MKEALHALIPARGGSKGVPKKNIKRLHGHPLLAYSIIACRLSDNIDRIIVSTDDKEIASIALKYGAEVPFVRPAEHASDSATDKDVIKHYFDQVSGSEVAYIRPTTPLREPAKLDEFIELYYESMRAKATGVRSMHILPESPYKILKISKSGKCQGFFRSYKGNKNYSNLPRQVFPAAYQPNGYIDIIKKETILGGTTFGNHTLPFITNFVLEVDTQDQFDLLQYKLKSDNHVLSEELDKWI
jgi:CMP-N-acetylneuraminic acid synthetase